MNEDGQTTMMPKRRRSGACSRASSAWLAFRGLARDERGWPDDDDAEAAALRCVVGVACVPVAVMHKTNGSQQRKCSALCGKMGTRKRWRWEHEKDGGDLDSIGNCDGRLSRGR
uniref:Uncharacterized protein n=1 Tax=Oryza rufipogon TaxID=4529 RepID=A0A0E0P5I4_ORYRU